MTLYRQLIIFTLLLFLILFTGTWFVKLETTRAFLVNQLESHAQDTATSLGLSLSQHLLDEDMLVVESMIGAVFDRGYYKRVRLNDIGGSVLMDRVLDTTIDRVPSWFISRVSLETPEMEAKVMAGWRQAGTVQVKSHPGYAYKALWEDVVQTTTWFAIWFIIVLVAGGFGLRLLLRPLASVERQADAICRKEYEVQERIPRTRDFRRVVEAMNRMTLKVKETFEEQVAQAQALRERAYHDPVADMGNRRYFESQVHAWLESGESVTGGILLLVTLNDLDQINRERGFSSGDEFIKRTGSLIQASMASFANRVVARLRGGDFGIFLPEVPPGEAGSIASRLAAALARMSTEGVALSDNVGYVGAAAYEIEATLERLLSEADAALASARMRGPNGSDVRVITEETSMMPLGQTQWKAMLETILEEKKITLVAQPVVTADDLRTPLHLEVFARIVLEDSTLLSAGMFIPLAERLKLVSSIDRVVIEEVLRLDRTMLGAPSVAVNMSPVSLQDLSFRQWLESALKDRSAAAPRIIFEFSEFSAVHSLDLIREFSLYVREQGHAIGLDHYGQSFTNLRYLQALRPEYVKIDRAYTGELKDETSDSRFFIASLCSVAHSIDILVVAEGVETEQQERLLRELKVDAIQGYLMEPPRPIKEMIHRV